MSILLRLISIYMVVVAFAVGVQFIVAPLYASSGEVWSCLGWFMGVGVLIALVVNTNKWMRGGSVSDLRQYLDVRTLFYASLVLFFWYFANVFGHGTSDYWHQLWWLINPLFFIVCAETGLRLWCGASSDQSKPSA